MPQLSRLDDLFEHAATGFAVTDTSGLVIGMNKAFARIVDRSPIDYGKANLFDWTHPEDRMRHQDLLDQLLASEIPGFVIEKRYLRPDGSSVWVRNSVSVLRDVAPRSPHLVSICEDISDRKQAERALAKQDHLASVGRLTSSILHEINNPLEAVMNLIYLARMVGASVEAQGFLKQAEEELSRAAEITTHGLKFHRQSGAPMSMNVGDIMDSVLVLLKGRLKERRIELTFEKQDGPELVCFAGEIRQAFVNLIGNAIDAMASGRRLIIRVRPGTVWRSQEPGVRVTIADTGPGIALSALAHIYEPFFTTKGSEGSGLGLWVTSNIVRKHQGLIHVRSKSAPVGGGTVFCLVFPHRGAAGSAPGFSQPA